MVFRKDDSLKPITPKTSVDSNSTDWNWRYKNMKPSEFFTRGKGKTHETGKDIDALAGATIQFVLSPFGAHSAPVAESPTLSHDVELFSESLSSIREAVNEDILSPDEAEALIKFVISRFMERRLGFMLDGLNEHHFVFAGSEGSHERRRETY